MPKVIPIERSETSAQLLFSVHNRVHILSLYLLRFLKLYPPSNLPLRKGLAGIAWKFSKPGNFSVTLKYSVSHYASYFIVSPPLPPNFCTFSLLGSIGVIERFRFE
jgi:hypothetical protein